MTGIDDRISEARALAEKFSPVVMNGAVPEPEDFYKLSIIVREILSWIKKCGGDDEPWKKVA